MTDDIADNSSNKNSDTKLIEVVSNIVSAYVGNNPVPVTELPRLIENTYNIVSGLNGADVTEDKAEQKPAVPLKKSLTNEYIICLEDGKKFKSLKRHLRTRYNMTPEQYREKWNLPADYPMVAPSYAQQRSDLAKRMGLGQAKK